MTTTPPAITTLPAAPDPNNRTTFNALAYPWSAALPTFGTQVSAVATNVKANADEAATSASTATTQAGLATTNGAAQVTLAANQVTLATTQAGLATTNGAAQVALATTQKTLAADQATIATAQAGISTTQAGISTTKASEAAASAVQASKLNLGNKASAPAVDNQGASLLAGATYYDTTLNQWRVWNGSGWVQGISSISGVSSFNGLTGDVTFAPTPAIKKPTNVTPTASATGVINTSTLTGSAYLSLYGTAMTASQWQVSTVNTFASTVISTGDVAGTAVSYTMAVGPLSVSTVYFWRTRYKNSDGEYSDWSEPFSFTTAAEFKAYIVTPAATPAAFGDAFEGGFYTGMSWNELVQSATSTVIGTGSKVFTVPSMTATPLVYAGQTLEVRSRSNPSSKMIGVVTDAMGTTLTINVTSVGGTGTFTDWSIMAQYRVIVAPKSTGESVSLGYKNTADSAPTACGTLSEGRKATLAMVAAGSSAMYPAAHFCNNLSISGRTDWYLPSRDELELCWRNLKPTADANYITANRGDSTIDYKNLGSLDDTVITHGSNNNTSPIGAAYIAGTPGQVAAGKNFRTGESEAFAYGSIGYWSASEFSATDAWQQRWETANPGYQLNTNKGNSRYVRAVRRSIT